MHRSPIVWLPVAAALLALAWAHNAQAQESAPPPDSISVPVGSGIGVAYWGVIPPPTDSVSVTFRGRPMPVWEGMLVWPYRVITFPLRLISDGIGESVEFLDEKRVIYSVARLLGPRRGPFGVVLELSAGGLPGLGGGVALEHDAFFGPRNRFRLRGAASTRGHRRLGLGMQFAAGEIGELVVGAGFRERSNARYFGLGPFAQRADSSFYRQKLAWGGASYRHSIGRSLFLTGDVLFSTIGTDLPRDDDVPPITQRFAGALPEGFDTYSHGVSFGLSLSHETASETGRPRKGGIRRLRAAYYRGLGDDDAAFWTYRAELQQFVRLWYPHNVLALRAHLTWLDPVGTDTIPFQRLMTNDDPDLMRGFRDFRWRDRGMVVFSAEYRWPVWVYQRPEGPGLDLYLLTDIGQVFNDFDQISVDNLTFSYGIGLRLLTARGLVLRLEYARSGEDAVWRLRTDQIFQFAKGGLFHGRDPVPIR